MRQISTSPEETTIVRAIISMGRSLNLRIIAEGVETVEELDFLKLHQCEEAQGYYFSRPVPPAKFAELLSDCPPGSVKFPRAIPQLRDESRVVRRAPKSIPAVPMPLSE